MRWNQSVLPRQAPRKKRRDEETERKSRSISQEAIDIVTVIDLSACESGQVWF